MATTTATKHRNIGKDDLKRKIDGKERFVLLNVLTEEYYRPDKNIPGSRHVSVDKLDENTAKQYAPDKNAQIVTYCGGGSCPASGKAAEKLSAMGYTNVSAYEGGIKEWEASGYPFSGETK